MKASKLMVSAAAAAVLLALAGCGSSLIRNDRFGEYVIDDVSDLTLAYHVKIALLAEPEVNELRTRVAVFEGGVQLSGFAHSPAEVQKIEQVAGGVRGVKTIRNDVAVQ